MHLIQRSGSSPTSQHDYRAPQPQPANIPGARLAQVQPQPQPNDPVAARPVAAALPPMPFPGPFAYAPGRAAPEADEANAHSSAPPVIGHDATPETTSSNSTTSSTSTASKATTSTITSTSAPATNPDNLPPLILAARQGDVPALDALIQGGQVDIDQVGQKYGSTALMFAAEEGHLDVVKMLLAARARVNDANDGATALTYAAAAGHINVVRRLVGRTGTELDQVVSNGDTALIIAASGNKPDVVATLLEAKADRQRVNYQGSTAVVLAYNKMHAAVIEVFLQHGEQPVEVDLLAPPQNPSTIIVADLQDDRAETATDLLAANQPTVFFDQLTSAMQDDGSGQRMVLWLRSMGFRAAVVQQVADILASASLAWPSHRPAANRPVRSSGWLITSVRWAACPGLALATKWFRSTRLPESALPPLSVCPGLPSASSTR